MPPGRTSVFSPSPAAGGSELANATASSGQEIPGRGMLLGVLPKDLPTKHRHGGQEEEDSLRCKPQEHHCVFSSAIFWYFTWELLTRSQRSCIFGIWQGTFLTILCSYAFQENTQPCIGQEKKAPSLLPGERQLLKPSAGEARFSLYKAENSVRTSKAHETGHHLFFCLWNCFLRFLHPCKEKS